jgi:predicted RNA-binding protein YlxR (DUF448 family)
MLAVAEPEAKQQQEPRPAGRGSAPPLRRCLASGEQRPQDELLRFVVSPDGILVPDLAGRLPGRGLWLSPDRRLLAKAIERRLFARAAKTEVRVPEGLAQTLSDQLRRSCLDLLGLGKRAGVAVAGHDKVRAWLEKGRAGLLLQAADSAVDGRRRLARLGEAVCPALRRIELFTAAELGAALGRDAAVHVAVAPGGIADRLCREAGRLERFGAVAPDVAEK